jgi:PilZ domain
MPVARTAAERRKWSRLPLAIPVFVRGHDGKGNEFLEFATALNVSAGGMLVAMRHVLPLSSDIRLEIPCAPTASLSVPPHVARNLRARALRNTPAAGYYLLGLKFWRPLLRTETVNGIRRRKLSSSM